MSDLIATPYHDGSRWYLTDKIDDHHIGITIVDCQDELADEYAFGGYRYRAYISSVDPYSNQDYAKETVSWWGVGEDPNDARNQCVALMEMGRMEDIMFRDGNNFDELVKLACGLIEEAHKKYMESKDE